MAAEQESNRAEEKPPAARQQPFARPVVLPCTSSCLRA
jgi:hypothetical protein